MNKDINSGDPKAEIFDKSEHLEPEPSFEEGISERIKN